MVFKPQTFHEIPPQAEMSDPTPSVLEATVAEALARAGAIDASRVTVTLANGIITLQGFVGSLAEIETAGDVAASVEGVTVIDNRLLVEAGMG
jgi:osmotically-inducible protein OsmY